MATLYCWLIVAASILVKDLKTEKKHVDLLGQSKLIVNLFYCYHANGYAFTEIASNSVLNWWIYAFLIFVECENLFVFLFIQ